MNLKNRSLFLSFSLCLLFSAALPCAAETWNFSAAEVSAGQNQGRTPTVLRGNAEVESQKLLIRSDRLELSGKDYTRITGEGNVFLRDKEKDIAIGCGRFEYDRETGIIHFRRQVEFTDESQNLVIRCEAMDLLEKEDIVIMQMAVRLIQDDIVCRGEFATFNRARNTLAISGRPVVWRGEDEYRANRITVNLDTDDISLEGTVSGALTTQEESSNEGASP